MGDLADVYESTRKELSAFVSGLSDEALGARVPATPDWTVKDIVAHLSADVVGALSGDFPREFFQAFGSPDGVRALNEWTARLVEERSDWSLQEILDEWEANSGRLRDALRDPSLWPDGTPPFVEGVFVTDLAVHQQDIYGALGMVEARDSAPVKIATGGYIVMVGLRLDTESKPSLTIEAEEKSWKAGAAEPAARVRVPTRFELFRALSGRRSPEQIRSYDWDGDASSYTDYFYPYGIREDALNE